MQTGRVAMSDHPVLDEDELTVLRLLSQGSSLAAIGRALNMSQSTVRRRCRATCHRLGVETSIEAVVWAVRRELI